MCQRRFCILLGDHHAANALAAYAVAIHCGVDAASAARALNEAVPLSEHRMAVTVRADQVTILDDAYNASPESMKAEVSSR